MDKILPNLNFFYYFVFPRLLDFPLIPTISVLFYFHFKRDHSMENDFSSMRHSRPGL